MKKLSLSFLILTLLTTCASDDPNPEPTAVYIAGYIVKDRAAVATYWKNGVATSLPGSPNGDIATSIAVNGSGVYVAGYELNENGNVAMYWRNGISGKLSDNQYGSIGYAVAVDGDNVYVAGSGYEKDATSSIAVNVWKNGNVHNSSRLQSNSIIGNSIAISTSGDVYIAGNEYDSYYQTNFARYWKNGVVTPLLTGRPFFNINTGGIPRFDPVPAGNANSSANAIALRGTDVYVVGSSGESMVYWKNGVMVSVEDNSDGNSFSEASAIAVYGSDVYLAGSHAGNGHLDACYWKNGVRVDLTHGPKQAGALGIAVFGNHVYVVGYDYESGTRVAKLWKDGVGVRLTDGIRSNASAIVVR